MLHLVIVLIGAVLIGIGTNIWVGAGVGVIGFSLMMWIGLSLRNVHAALSKDLQLIYNKINSK
jgi:uncharacterized membrane protein YczE